MQYRNAIETIYLGKQGRQEGVPTYLLIYLASASPVLDKKRAYERI
jgi:hypothetical protein